MMNRSIFWRRRAGFWFCPVCGAQAAALLCFFRTHIGGGQRQGGRDHQRGQTTQHRTGEGDGSSQSWSSFATQVRGGVDRWFAEDARFFWLGLKRSVYMFPDAVCCDHALEERCPGQPVVEFRFTGVDERRPHTHTRPALPMRCVESKASPAQLTRTYARTSAIFFCDMSGGGGRAMRLLYP